MGTSPTHHHKTINHNYDIKNTQNVKIQADNAKAIAKINKRIAKIKADKEIAKEQTKRIRIQANNDKEIARINAENDDKQRIHDAQQKQYERERAERLEQHKVQQEKYKLEQQAQMQKDKQAHEQKLEQIEAKKQDKQQKIVQKNAAIQQITAEIGELTNRLKNDKTALKNAKEELKTASEELVYENNWIKGFDIYKATELNKKSDDLQLNDTKKKFERCDKQISTAIDRTGIHDDDIGKFLKLTHSLIGATVVTNAQSNKLNIQMSTFGDIINRLCQDKLTIKYYFNEMHGHLNKFIPVLSKENFIYLNDLKCKDENEYEDVILRLLENDIKKQMELDKKTNNDNDNNNNNQKGKPVAASGKDLLTKWKLDKFYDTFVNEGLDDPDDWKYLSDVELEGYGFKPFQIKKFNQLYKKWSRNSGDDLLLLNDRRTLKEICLPSASWQKHQLDKVKSTKEGLMIVCPLLGDFFLKIHGAIQQTQQMLKYDKSLNNQQKKAINNVYNLPPIEYTKNNEYKDTDNKSSDERREWKIGSKVEIYSDSIKKWFNGEIINITNDNQGEWLDVKYTTSKENKTKQIGRGSSSIRAIINKNDLTVQCCALKEASFININVTGYMVDRFHQSSLTLSVLPIAYIVESCCRQIIESQGAIRQSVLLAQEILKYKPASMSNEAKKLWNSVDNGIINIFQSALQIVDVSSKYFGYFLKFSQSCHYYVSTNQNNPNISLINSLEHLKQDVRDFNKFQKDFDKTLDKLRKEAMNCIKNCVKDHVGAVNFEKYKASREEALQKWLEKKKIWDQKASQLDVEFDQHQKKRITKSAKEVMLQYKVYRLEQSIKRNQEIQESYSKTKAYLEKMII